MRCFSSLGLHGYSGINARLTTPPDFSQSSTPLRLLVPRHPPHALTSLTTLLSSPDDLRQDPVPFEACHPSPGIAFARLGNNSFFPSKAHSSFNLHSNSNYSPSPLRVSPRLEGSARSRLDATFTHSKLSKIAGRPMTLCRLARMFYIRASSGVSARPSSHDLSQVLLAQAFTSLRRILYDSSVSVSTGR